jgi:hypothetical protein
LPGDCVRGAYKFALEDLLQKVLPLRKFAMSARDETDEKRTQADLATADKERQDAILAERAAPGITTLALSKWATDNGDYSNSIANCFILWHGNTSQIDQYLSEVAVVYKASIASKASMTNERKTLVDGVHTAQFRIAEIDDEFQLTPVAHILDCVHEIAGCLHKDIEEGLARLVQRPYSRGMIDTNADFHDITSTLTENVFTRIKNAADKYLAPVKPGARMQRGQTVSFSSVPTTYDGEQTRTSAGAPDELTTADEAQHLDQERIQPVTRSTN